MSAAQGLICDLGRMDYVAAEALQEKLVAARRTGQVPDTLLFVEHEPVITVGGSADEADAEVEVAAARAAGLPVYRVARGGRATWHGPGQVVGYSIMDLRAHRTDLHWYLRALEQVLIEALDELGIVARRVDGLTGVWVGERKVASIGIAVRGWVTWHGFAVNVDCDPAVWRLLQPCGLPAEAMASLAEVADTPPARDEVTAALAHSFAAHFGLDASMCTIAELLRRAGF